VPAHRGSIALSLAVLAAAGSCAAGASSDGPLSVGSGELEWCTQGSEGGARHTLADRRVQVEGSAPVTIRSIDLVDARELEILDAVLVPSEGQGLIGARRNWPPDTGPGLGSLPDTWAERVPAIGATVEPDSDWNLAIGLESASAQAGADSIVIRYEDASGTEFEADYPTTIEVRTACG
jgi:hypothetical protein